MLARLMIAALFCFGFTATTVAAPIRFDFGNGNVSDDTGVAANVVIAEGTTLVGNQTATISGTTITLQGIGPSGSVWGATAQGIGIIPENQLGMAAPRRIDGTIGEFVYFSFDIDATINSIRLGNLTMAEEVEIAFVSGVDPFSGGSFTVTGIAPAPTDDIPVDVFVNAGTVLSLTASDPRNNGVLWNDVVVTPIPEPSSGAMLVVAVLAAVVHSRHREVTCRHSH